MVFLVLWYNFYGDVMYKNAIKILNILENNGYKAYIVGGYVRDKILNVKSNDIDIITNALPDEVCMIFNIEHIDNFGSIKLKYNNYIFEVTTFRKEYYKNNDRRPYKVEYIDDLKEDLMRRDFNINSICIDKNGMYIDLLNGINDINNKIIRCIGNANTKINEDPLRILRAIRFSLVYDFNIEDNLMNTIYNNVEKTRYLSFDRIKKELDIIFNVGKSNKLLNLINYTNMFKILEIKPKNSLIECYNYLGIWAQLDYSNKYNFTKKEFKIIMEVKEIINSKTIDNYALYKYSMDSLLISSKILKIDDIEKRYLNLPIHSRSDIDIKYNEIKKYTNSSDINKIYVDLEKQILYNKLKNKNLLIKKYLEGSDNFE